MITTRGFLLNLQHAAGVQSVQHEYSTHMHWIAWWHTFDQICNKQAENSNSCALCNALYFNSISMWIQKHNLPLDSIITVIIRSKCQITTQWYYQFNYTDTIFITDEIIQWIIELNDIIYFCRALHLKLNLFQWCFNITEIILQFWIHILNYFIFSILILAILLLKTFIFKFELF